MHVWNYAWTDPFFPPTPLIISKNFSAWWWQLLRHDSYHVALGRTGKHKRRSNTLARMLRFAIAERSAATMGLWQEAREAAVCVVCARCADWTWAVVTFWAMAAAIASGLIRQKRQAREQHLDRPSTNRRRKSPNKNKGLCNGNLVDIFSKVRIFGLRKRRLRRQGLGTSLSGWGGRGERERGGRCAFDVDCAYIYLTAYGPN